MTTTFIVEWDSERLSTIILAIVDMKKKVKELQIQAEGLAEELSQGY